MCRQLMHWPTSMMSLVVWLPFFVFPYIGKNHPNWLIFLRGVHTTNQMMSFDWITACCTYCPMDACSGYKGRTWSCHMWDQRQWTLWQSVVHDSSDFSFISCSIPFPFRLNTPKHPQTKPLLSTGPVFSLLRVAFLAPVTVSIFIQLSPSALGIQCH